MAANRHSYIRFFPSDWIAGTGRMPPVVRLVYFEVCLYNWDKAEAMPRGEQTLVFLQIDGWRDALEALLSAGKLKRTRGGGLYSDRALIEARSAVERYSNAKAAGSVGGRKAQENKRKSESDTPRVARPNQNQNQNQKTPQGPPEGGDSLFELEPPDEDLHGLFEAWWGEYPNKVGKGKAEQAFGKALEKLSGSAKSKTAQLVFSLRAQKRVWRRKGVEGKFIPHPATWLNQSRWTDDEVVAEATRKLAPRRDGSEPEVTPPTPRAGQRSKPVVPAGAWSPEDEE